MGAPVGAFVRVKCTAPAIELNNAKLLAVTKTTITIASAKGERFTLPKEATVVEAPVNWQRTTTVVNEQPPRSEKGSRSWILLLLLLPVLGVAAWFRLARRREAETEVGGRTTPRAAARSVRAATRPSRAEGRPFHAEARPFHADAPPQPKAELESDSVEKLIENRRYGTAIEHLERQIKLKPDEYELKLQLLKVYSLIENSKQVDRVLRQIEFHPAFSPEQKQRARETVSASKDKERAATQPAATQPQPAAARPATTQSATTQSAAAPPMTAPPAAARSAAARRAAAPSPKIPSLSKQTSV